MIVPPHTKYSFSPLFSNFSFGPEQVYKDNDKEQGQQLTGRSTDTIAKQMVLLQPTGKHHHHPHWRESEPTLITLRCRPPRSIETNNRRKCTHAKHRPTIVEAAFYHQV